MLKLVNYQLSYWSAHCTKSSIVR